MTKKQLEDRLKLIKQMYPKALADNPDYEWDENESITIGKLASDITDNLRQIIGKPMDSTGALCHAAMVLISTLQRELKTAKGVIKSLVGTVEACEATFSETCDCGECGACGFAKTFESDIKKGNKTAERIALTLM